MTFESSAMYPNYTENERFADGVVHVVGLVFGTWALSLLLLHAVPVLPGAWSGTLAVYGIAMLLMFSCSAAYHMVPHMSWKGVLRRFDQAAIFFKIAGTYTPFALLKMGGHLGVGLFSTVWLVAVMGAGMVLGMRNKPTNAIVILYLGLGWLGVALIWPLAMSLSWLALSLLGAGGVLYTVGVVFHVWESLPFQNVIWHIFVLIATMCHYGAVYVAVLIDV